MAHISLRDNKGESRDKPAIFARVCPVRYSFYLLSVRQLKRARELKELYHERGDFELFGRLCALVVAMEKYASGNLIDCVSVLQEEMRGDKLTKEQVGIIMRDANSIRGKPVDGFTFPKEYIDATN